MAAAAAPAWAAVPADERAAMLERAAERLDAEQLTLIALPVREAGKTVANALAEVREAIDFPTRRWRACSARRAPATSTSTATSSARWSACSRRRPVRHRPQGGRLYLLRLLQAAPADAARRAVQRSGAALDDAPLRALRLDAAPDEGLALLQQWAAATGRDALAQACTRFAAATPVAGVRALPGPTGESNLYALQPRAAVLCLADVEADRLLQLAAVLAVGGQALWPAAHGASWQALPEGLRSRALQLQD